MNALIDSRVYCPACGVGHSVTHNGKSTVRCMRCGADMPVPRSAEAAPKPGAK